MTQSSLPPPTSRSAHEAIAGYEYQFDKTVITLLGAADTDTVTIEGIEDVDLHTPKTSEAVQIKYFAGQKYRSPKTLRDPVRLMLDHYRTGAHWNYVLYVHFGDFNGMPDRFDVTQLKKSLTKKPQNEEPIEYFTGLENAALKDFCSRLKLVRGDAYATQEAAMVDALRTAMSCDVDEVTAIYTAKAREFVHERARSGDPSARTVTRADFIEVLNIKDFLHDKWQMQKIGADRYLAAQKRRLRSGGFRDPTKRRAVYMDLVTVNLDEVVELCQVFSRKYLTRLKSAQPWTAIIHGTRDEVRQLKIRLARSGVAFNDGHEDLEFQSRSFIEAPIINTRGAGGNILRSSFSLRIVSHETFRMEDPSIFRISRLVSIGPEQYWMERAGQQVFTLRNFELPICMQLMEEIA